LTLRGIAAVADEKALNLLKQGPVAWNEQRKLGKYGGYLPEADLLRMSEADLLNEANLRRADLRGANLRGADLSGADLFWADLSQADLSGAYLIGANLIRADLIEANLIQANLSGADLGGADLSAADLRGADLRGADLIRSDLSGANLIGAYLIGVELSKADLSGADLSGAYLLWANLGEAILSGADVSQSTVEATIFADLDLSTVQGLESVIHSGPSTIGIDTIYKSKGRIPEIFLRGAGVPEPFIVQMKALVSALSPVQFYSCFISYSHADKPFARALHDTLQGRGIRCWLDEKQLLFGDDLYDQIDRGIRLWDKLLLCCSEHSLKPASWVEKEIITGLEKEDELTRTRGAKVQVLVPLNLDGYIFSDQWKSSYRAEIRRRLAADFTGWGADRAKFEEQVENVILALLADAAAPEAPPERKL
jgi:hypothetical protein